METKKIYILSIILIVILLFSTAALCNLCGLVTAGQTDKTDEETTVDTGGSRGADKDSAPQIKLEIYEGPTYSATDDICYYRIRADVSGNPKPDVSFSRDDSNGKLGELKAQINLKKGETYKLKATAKNSEGTDDATIDLKWGCDDGGSGVVKAPVITGVEFSEPELYTDVQYEVKVIVDNPGGDTLHYYWLPVGGGTILNASVNPTHWIAPAAPGNYKIEVHAANSGGEDVKIIDVTVNSTLLVSMNAVDTESGWIERDTFVNHGRTFAGKTNNDLLAKGFFSFDISMIPQGSKIVNTKLSFYANEIYGDEHGMGTLTVIKTDWGDVPIKLSDFYLTGDVICTSDNAVFSCTDGNLKPKLQDSVNSAQSRFQIMYFFDLVAIVADGQWIGWANDPPDVSLEINYAP